MKKNVSVKCFLRLLTFLSIIFVFFLFGSCKGKNSYFETIAEISVEPATDIVVTDVMHDDFLLNEFTKTFPSISFTDHIYHIKAEKKRSPGTNVLLLEQKKVNEEKNELFYYFSKITDNLEDIYLTEPQILMFIISNPDIINEKNKIFIFLTKGYNDMSQTNDYYIIAIFHADQRLKIVRDSFFNNSYTYSLQKCVFVIRE